MQWRRVFRSRGLYCAIAIQVFSFLYPHMDTSMFFYEPIAYFQSSDFFYFFLMPGTLGLCMLMLPFVAVLPSATLAAEDFETGFIRLLLARCGKAKYGITRAFQAMTGAAAASVIGSGLYLAFILCVCPGDSNIEQSWRDTIASGSFGPLGAVWNGLPVVFDYMIRFAYAAAVWSLVGTGFGFLSKQGSLSLILTFLIHFSLVYFFSWGSAALFYWSPDVIQSPSISTTLPLGYIYRQQTVYFIGALVFCGTCMYAGLREIQ